MKQSVLCTLLMVWCTGMCADLPFVVGEPLSTFVLAADDFCDTGITLSGHRATCVFESRFALSGPLDLRGGTLSLARDVVCDSHATVRTAGVIAGNGHALHTPYVADEWVLPRYPWVRSAAKRCVQDGAAVVAYACGFASYAFVSHEAPSRACLVAPDQSVYYCDVSEYITNLSIHPSDACTIVVSSKHTGCTLSCVTYTGALQRSVSDVFSGLVTTSAWSGDGSRFACAVDTASGAQLRVYAYNETGLQLLYARILSGGLGSSVLSCAWNDDATQCVIARAYAPQCPQIALYAITDTDCVPIASAHLFAHATSVMCVPGDRDRIIVGVKGGAFEGALRLYQRVDAKLVLVKEYTVGPEVLHGVWNKAKSACVVVTQNNESREWVLSFWNRDGLDLLCACAFPVSSVASVHWSDQEHCCVVCDSAGNTVTYQVFDGMGLISLSLIAHAPLKVRGTVTIEGTVLWDGNGNQVRCEHGGSFVLSRGATLVLRDVVCSDDAPLVVCGERGSRVVIERCEGPVNVADTLSVEVVRTACDEAPRNDSVAVTPSSDAASSVIEAPTHVLFSDLFVTPTSPLLITQSTCIDGNGHTIWCTQPDAPLWVLAPGVSITFTNVVVRGVSPESFVCGDAARVIWGDKSRIVLESGELDVAWICKGAVVIDGQGATISYQGFGALMLEKSAMVTVKRLTFLQVATGRLVCNASDAQLIIGDDVRFHLSDEWCFDQGTLVVTGRCSYQGAHDVCYASSEQSQVCSGAQLCFSDGCRWVVRHDDRIAPHLLCDETSTLIFDNAGICVERGFCMISNAQIVCRGAVTFDARGGDILLGTDVGAVCYTPEVGAYVHAYGTVVITAVD